MAAVTVRAKAVWAGGEDRPRAGVRGASRSGRKTRLTAAMAILALGAACRQDMHDQPKQKPLAKSEFFADQRSARPLVEGTVARGHLKEDAAFYTGKTAAGLADTLPMPVTAELLQRGRTRYETYCAPCHGQAGYGDGMIVRRGFKAPSSFHVDRVRAMPVGWFFDVATSGFGSMSDYSSQVSTADRWAIAAYIRALQLSQHATVADVPADKRDALDGGATKPAAPAAGRH
jgi:mono/diheme cytochrome c family protein